MSPPPWWAHCAPQGGWRMRRCPQSISNCTQCSLSWAALCFPTPHHDLYYWWFLSMMESSRPECPPEQGLSQISVLLVKNFQTIRVGKSLQLIQTGPQDIFTCDSWFITTCAAAGRSPSCPVWFEKAKWASSGPFKKIRTPLGLIGQNRLLA